MYTLWVWNDQHDGAQLPSRTSNQIIKGDDLHKLSKKYI